MVELAADGRFEVLDMLAVLMLLASSGWLGPELESCWRGGRYSRYILPPRMLRTLSPLSPAPPWSSWVTQKSHSSHPRKVAKLPHPTTDTGLTRSWNMPTKHTTNIMTEQTCCRITVESATKGQKS